MSAVLETNWADNQLPEDNDARAKVLRSRVKMHEFLATGGIQTGYVEGIAQYSDPVDLTPGAVPECPWHPTVSGQTSCAAWEEVQAGRLTNEAGDLARLREMTDDELRDRVLAKRAAREAAEAKWEAENPELAKRNTKFNLDAPAPKPSQPYKKPKRTAGEVAKKFLSDITPVETQKKRAVDASALLGDAVPDSIEIEGDEE